MYKLKYSCLLPAITLLILGFSSIASSRAQETKTRCYSNSEVSLRTPGFEIVSIKESDPKANRSSMDIDPDGLRFEGFTLRDLVGFAYGMNKDLIVDGPKWVDSARYSIQAKVSESDVLALKKMNRTERKAMLRSVLEDRFGLKVRCEPRKLPVYELVIAKGGSKLKIHPPDAAQNNGQAGSNWNIPGELMVYPSGRIKGVNVSISVVVKQLQSMLHQTVIDKTRLAANYDFNLSWSSDEPSSPSAQASSESAQKADKLEGSEPSIFTALQEQLGLKLVPAKDMIDALVINDAHMPRPN